MAITPFVQAVQARVLSSQITTPVLRAGMSRAFGAIAFPTPFEQVSQAGVFVSARGWNNDMQVSQSRVFAAVRGAVANTSVRTFTITLDGHDFYIVRLGDAEVLIFDDYSQQWTVWQSGISARIWRANKGLNWFGANKISASFGSSIIIGDDVFGVLWVLDPLLGQDQNVLEDGELQPFLRTLMGQVPMRKRDVMPCYEVFLTTDKGGPAYSGAFVTLEISDDAGKNFHNAGSIISIEGDFGQEMSWPSLGQITEPGRLFRITDNGAFTRADSFDMTDDPADDEAN